MKKILKVAAVGGLMMTLWHKKGQGKTNDQTVNTKLPIIKGRKPFPVIGSMLLAGAVITAPAYAMSESAVQEFASSLNTAANAQNIGMVSRLIDDNAVISLTRNGNTTTLDKNGYLQLLQKSWAEASDYRYSINVTDVVVAGSQARANVITTESWIKDGRRTTFRTHSKATLSYVSGNAMLLRAVSQVTVE